jgi:hypothetical protein
LSDDDVAYRKSVRNTLLVLAVVLLALFAAFVAGPYLTPAQNQFQTEGSVASPLGFILSVRLTATHPAPNGSLGITAWMNSTSNQIENITSGAAWPLNPSYLYGATCTPGWPVGIGIMKGFYSSDNYTQGTLIDVALLQPCPRPHPPPSYFLLQPHGSSAVVNLNGTLQFWNLSSTLVLGPGSPNKTILTAGTYTALTADEWGDVVISHFVV